MRTGSALSRLALAVLLVAAPAGAAVETYGIDGAHSSAAFRIRHFFTKVPGQFAKLTGNIDFDPADLGTAKIKATIDAASINTNDAKRDAHLRSPDFFDAEKYPEIAFESTGVAVKGKDQAVLRGNLTMHGVTKPVELQVTRLGSLTDPWGNQRVGFEGTTTVNRKDFGIEWNKVLDAGSTMLGDEVEVTLAIEAVRKKAEAAKPEAGKAEAPKAPAAGTNK